MPQTAQNFTEKNLCQSVLSVAKSIFYKFPFFNSSTAKFAALAVKAI